MQDFSHRLSSARSEQQAEQQAKVLHQEKVYGAAKEALEIIFRELKSLEQQYQCQVILGNGAIPAVTVVAPIEFEKRMFHAEVPVKTVEFFITASPYEIKFGPEQGQIELGFKFSRRHVGTKMSAYGPYPTNELTDMSADFRRSPLATAEDALNHAARCLIYIFDGFRVRKR